MSVFTINIISNDLSIFSKSLILCYLQDCCIYHILCVLSSDTHLALVLHFTLLYFCILSIFVKTIVDFGIFYLEICISLLLFFFFKMHVPTLFSRFLSKIHNFHENRIFFTNLYFYTKYAILAKSHFLDILQ